MNNGREVYELCMLIGNIFNQKYRNNDKVYDWHGSEECATVAELTCDLITVLNTTVEQAFDLVMESVLTNGFKKVDDHAWDFYTRGFLAGQILGDPTEDNMKKAEKADEIWDNDYEGKYGYYQEVLEEVKKRGDVVSKKYVKQYSIDILVDENENITEEQIAEALESVGYPVLACAWKATWEEDDYWDEKPPVSYN